MAIRVFLADDHAVVREGLRLILEMEADICVVGEATDGREAVHRVRDLAPDVVLMDIAMPMLNGIEATRHITTCSPATQVVILSMYGTLEHISRALVAGARGYVIKESAGKEVVNAVRTVQARKRYLSQKILDSVVSDYLLKHKTLPEKSPLESLSPREREVLQLVVEGRTSAEIATLLFLSPKTVATYRSRLMQKLGVKNLPGLVKFAVLHGLIGPE
jgi:DNA-binding NarL/FixJ family response regulator